MNKKNLVSLMILLSMSSSVFAAANYTYEQNANTYQIPQVKSYKGYVSNLASGTVANVIVPFEISSATLEEGQTVSMKLTSNLYSNGNFIAPKDSVITGVVNEVKKATFGTQNGKLKITFNQIITPEGDAMTISGLIKTNDGSGVLTGGAKVDSAKTFAKDAIVGSGAGALSGVVFGALASGDSLGRGAALGTAVGAGVGLAKAGLSKGIDVIIPANSTIDIVLTNG